MAHLIQVGAGSGGMAVLDLVCRDPRIRRLTLIEPDVYKPHNVERHLFPPSGVGRPKAELAEAWLKERRPDLEVRLLQAFVNRQESPSPTLALAPPATLPLWLGVVAVAAVLLAFAVISFLYFASGPGPRHPTPPRANKERATSLAHPPAGAAKEVSGRSEENAVHVGPRRAGFLGRTHLNG